MEIDLNANGSQIVLGDFFTVRDGKITRLAIYSLTPDGGRLSTTWVSIRPAARRNRWLTRVCQHHHTKHRNDHREHNEDRSLRSESTSRRCRGR